MDKKRIGKSLFVSLTAAILVGSISIVSGAVLMEPGSEEDPIITLSYVEKRLEQIKYYINQNIENMTNEITAMKTETQGVSVQVQELATKVNGLSTQSNNSNPTGGTTEKFKVVFIEEGSTIYLGESTEIIWRSGRATIIASQQGGLADLTIGKDLQMGEEVPLNHLILVPRNDGRGMSTITSSYVMIKGGYTIK